jgi:hypothetical protein
MKLNRTRSASLKAILLDQMIFYLNIQIKLLTLKMLLNLERLTIYLVLLVKILFFKSLNKNILKNLEEDNGYCGDILKVGQPKGATFSLDQVVGASMFHKTIMENFPETKDILDI